MIELRPAQRKCADEGLSILKRHNLLYLAAEVRTGKSLISMTIAKEFGAKRVTFISVLKALSSIKDDYHNKLGHKFDSMLIINYEQAHKLIPDSDLYIIDEATRIGAYPKPNKGAKILQELIFQRKVPVILMSGTPTPESPSQIFHQLWISWYSPFSIYKNFYSWAKDYVKHYDMKTPQGMRRKVKQIYLRGLSISDYSEGIEAKIKEVTKHYTVTLSQVEAGFQSFVQEKIFYIDIKPEIYQLLKVLKKDKVYKMKKSESWIIADTPVKMQSVFHQLCSGTIITDNGSYVIDDNKARFIKSNFKGKLAIYYHFVAEGELLRKMFPVHTDIPEVFNENENVTFICQMVSGRMGVNLSTADWVIMYNIGFSATTYFQIRARMQTQERTKASQLAWLFSRNGIESKIYKVVTTVKAPYTLNYFKRDLSEF